MQERVKQQKGFTIVELLIVIVVIAILAAITVVAYTGIQNRAQNTQTVSATTTYLKAMMQYKAENGIYPDTYNSGYHITCLGGVENATNCDGVFVPEPKLIQIVVFFVCPSLKCYK